MRSRHTIIEFPVFSDYRVHVEVSSDIKKSMQKYPEIKHIDMDDNTNAIAVHEDDGNFSFIFFPYDVSVGTIAHESWHVIRNMMKFVGIELDSETVAYHLGYMVNHIVKFIKGRK